MSEESIPLAVLLPNEVIWHLVEVTVSKYTMCGMPLLYGTKMKPWDKSRDEARCVSCVRSLP